MGRALLRGDPWKLYCRQRECEWVSERMSERENTQLAGLSSERATPMRQAKHRHTHKRFWWGICELTPSVKWTQQRSQVPQRACPKFWIIRTEEQVRRKRSERVNPTMFMKKKKSTLWHRRWKSARHLASRTCSSVTIWLFGWTIYEHTINRKMGGISWIPLSGGPDYVSSLIRLTRIKHPLKAWNTGESSSQTSGERIPQMAN